MTDGKRKRGRPVNEERQKLEKSLGFTGQHVRRVLRELGADRIKDLGELKLLERQVTIAFRHIRGQREAHELDRQRKLDSGELIPVDFATKLYVGALLEIRAQLAMSPDRLCARLDPDNPERARRILQDELVAIGAAVEEKIRAL
jgi:hypothetical protein